MDTGHGPEEYSFLQEIIKDEQKDLKKIVKKIAKWAILGFVFGMTACMGFFALKPWAEATFQKDTDKVEIPKDEEAEEVTQTETVTEPVQQELTIENYRELNQMISEVTAEAQKCVVQVTGIAQDGSWANEQDADALQSAGLIVADNGRELLILTSYSSIKDASLFQVKFVDGTDHEAVLKQKDGTTNLAIFSVAKSGISEDTWAKIKVAELGNSNTLPQGRTLIAVGSPFSYADGVGVGVASSVDETIIRADGKYSVIITDMPEADKSSGFLFDTYGNVQGIIDSSLMNEGSAGTLSAIGISAVKSEIELMSNGKNVPYVGIVGTVVTKEMSEAQGIPVGLYVTEVEVDSPAMKAGIQSGDVITKVGGNGFSTLEGYRKAILNQEAGKTITLTGQRRGAENYVDIKFSVTVGVKQ
ncbi:MAG: PDZ domain-containing protein [Tyzzerella sp.]|nr:PDZ domain-containing protein [Tyzzerella sp.]